ncbi:MAG: hypothetical protein LBC72_04585, partial [Spirochaetaceae bacterium]|nr:hypothetical protein [Spirochaetaceae bacterium]
MEYEAVQAGFFSILPPLIAIVLALITKEVIFSLVLGIFSGTIIYGVFTGGGVTAICTSTVEVMIRNVSANA